MTTIKTIPVDGFGGLDVRQGDTLRILASRGDELVVEIHRETASQPMGSGNISQWLLAARLTFRYGSVAENEARGSVKLELGECADDVRMDYYAAKYGLDR